MKRRDSLTELRRQSVADLTAALTKTRSDILALSFSRAFRKQKNIREARELRKQIARLETLLREAIAARALPTAGPRK